MQEIIEARLSDAPYFYRKFAFDHAEYFLWESNDHTL